MGGSLAAALAKAGWKVLLHHRRPEVADRAADLGYGEAVSDPVAAMPACDVAVVCTPVGVIAETVRALAKANGDAVITDVGSTKAQLSRELADLAASGRYLGSHPMAGTHLQGLEHAKADLYQDRLTVITPVGGTPPAALNAIREFWRAVGSRTIELPPAQHDAAVARASHLPHIFASAIAAQITPESLPLASSGFADTTRVAAGSPEIWTDILLHNRDAIASGLKQYRAHLDNLQKALDASNEKAIRAWLEEGKAGRDRFDRRTTN